MLSRREFNRSLALAGMAPLAGLVLPGCERRVEIVPAALDEGRNAVHRPGHFLNHYKNVIGAVADLPPDAALNHDHYLYGLPKK